MVAIKAFVLFALERVRCVILALATIVLVKVAALLVLAPLADGAAAPAVSEAATPRAIVRLP